MKINKKLRTWLGHYRFVKDAKRVNRKPQVVNFEEAVRIGVLYDATDDRDSESIKNYVRNMRNNYKKDVLAMGYVDKKSLRKTQYAQRGLDFFTRKDLNFRMIPVSPIVHNFINEKFDILINLNSGKCFPLKYISALSNAKFRVGRYNLYTSDCFDMMIKIKGEPPLKTILEEMEHFLRLIKKHESE
jgi:hypothetical protein